ncbi:hypothetical protein RclHR1_10130005 [Rhizophagus clarus]|uniref:Uncharacterized protein n=1 Tax=Rhizophagus clarus TaxID=94130 RepID=A0A2Z6Q0T7_9GLOM|nr:hypothetical protein RclHR1_10130005 [Rhizophagus clarus]GES72631.1 hypothetical protein GLOIN_2v1574096 [Rhizophagus clarus]
MKIIENETPFEFHYSLALIILMIMASLHNLIKSILIYQVNTSKLLSTIKLILNSSGLIFGISNIGILFTKIDMSLAKCFAVTYLQIITNFIFSELIMIFLICKIRQLGKLNDRIGYLLLLTRSLLFFIYIALSRPQITFDGKCDNGMDDGRMFLLGATITDLLIDAYLIFHLIQYTKKFLKSNQNIPLPQKTIIWNSLIIFLASIQHINIIILSDPIIGYTIQTVVFISLSYIITFEVKSDNPTSEESSENDLEWARTSSNISIISEDMVFRASNGMLANMSLKDVRNEIKMEQGYNIERIDEDVGVSQESITFYEIVSMFLGKRDKRQSV